VPGADAAGVVRLAVVPGAVLQDAGAGGGSVAEAA
jgi:precorrin-6B methylase 2